MLIWYIYSTTVKKMMRHIASILLSVIVIIATSGYTVFHHTCYSSQTSELSVIVPEFSCDHSQNHDEDHETSCCAIPVTEEEGNTCGDSDCCDTETYSIDLDVTFYSPDQIKKVNQSDIQRLLPEIEVVTQESENLSSQFYIYNDLPPPLSGRTLHIFLNQLNIPDPSV